MRDPDSINVINVDLLDESVEFSLSELCRICAIEESLVVAIVEEGIVEPGTGSRAGWRFSGVAVTRIQRVVQLQNEFAVNLSGAALALELFEEIARLKRLQPR